jgi:hypothetical protein
MDESCLLTMEDNVYAGKRAERKGHLGYTLNWKDSRIGVPGQEYTAGLVYPTNFHEALHMWHRYIIGNSAWID